MAVLPDIALCLISAFAGSLVGSLFWTFHLGVRWLRRVLVDESALNEFWALHFKPHGGTGAMRKEELAGLERVDNVPFTCQTVIRVEVETLIKLRRWGAVALAGLCAVCLLISAYTSVAIPICFVAGAIVAVPLRNQKYPMQSLATIFCAIRRWMDIDRPSLEEYGPQCIRAIVRVLDANEPVKKRRCDSGSAATSEDISSKRIRGVNLPSRPTRPQPMPCGFNTQAVSIEPEWDETGMWLKWQNMYDYVSLGLLLHVSSVPDLLVFIGEHVADDCANREATMQVGALVLTTSTKDGGFVLRGQSSDLGFAVRISRGDVPQVIRYLRQFVVPAPLGRHAAVA